MSGVWPPALGRQPLRLTRSRRHPPGWAAVSSELAQGPGPFAETGEAPDQVTCRARDRAQVPLSTCPVVISSMTRLGVWDPQKGHWGVRVGQGLGPAQRPGEPGHTPRALSSSASLGKGPGPAPPGGKRRQDGLRRGARADAVGERTEGSWGAGTGRRPRPGSQSESRRCLALSHLGGRGPGSGLSEKRGQSSHHSGVHRRCPRGPLF